MLKIISSFFNFILPIVRKAVVQVAADELSKAAYGNGRPARRYNRSTPYSNYVPRQRSARTRSSEAGKHEARSILRSEFHDVLLVAFDLRGRDARDVQTWLGDNLPEAGTFHGDADEIYLDSWWIANDERFIPSDTDSAVFVKKGSQEEARALLREHGLGN